MALDHRLDLRACMHPLNPFLKQGHMHAHAKQLDCMLTFAVPSALLHQVPIPVLLGFGEDEQSRNRFRLVIKAGSQAGIIQRSAELADERLAKVAIYLMKLGAIENKSQIIHASSIANTPVIAC